jgi:hypothetical protein
MQIQLNTDHNIEGHERLVTYVTGLLEDNLSRFSERITRVEIHLADESGGKSGAADKRCVMEARLQHHQPSAVTHHAATLDDALHGAVRKLRRSIESLVGRLEAREGSSPDPLEGRKEGPKT